MVLVPCAGGKRRRRSTYDELPCAQHRAAFILHDSPLLQLSVLCGSVGRTLPKALRAGQDACFMEMDAFIVRRV